MPGHIVEDELDRESHRLGNVVAGVSHASEVSRKVSIGKKNFAIRTSVVDHEL